MSSISGKECNESTCIPEKVKLSSLTDCKRFEDEKKTTQIVYSYKGGKKIPKLREPRNLFTFNEERKLLAPRWPKEVKVLKVRLRFSENLQKEPEPFYKHDTNEVHHCKHADNSGLLVYDNSPGEEKYFKSSCVGGTSIPNKPYYSVESPEDDTLIFESRFESGNLKRAVKVGPYEYQLWMRTDLYTTKHTQWFFFRVRNTKAGIRYCFHLMNFTKSKSLYNNGMQPLMYSELDTYYNNTGWVRTGSNIKYYKNDIRREDSAKDRFHYTLTWQSQFNYSKDTCYFAHCYPYTYSDLQEYLLGIRNDPIKARNCKQRVLCRTLCGNLVHILTITDPSRRPADAEAKRAVVITARVHPGETNSSWMMKGLLDFLISNNPDAKLLRETFVFKIVPMINPDGVIVGNYRCSLAGRDLNRNYKTSLKESYPAIWHIKNMVKKLLQEREIILYCDFHGHSRKQNVFMYGCDNKNDITTKIKGRVFPMMLSKNAPFKFSYKGCKFKVQKSKEGTGRIVMWNLGIMNSFTLEATFCGSSIGKKSGFHFNWVDLEAMGYHICDTLLDFCDPDGTKYNNLLKELEEQFKRKVLERMIKNGTPLHSLDPANVILDAGSFTDFDSSTDGSDSSESDGLPMHLMYSPNSLQRSKNSKKKKLRSRKEHNNRRARAKALKIKDVILSGEYKPQKNDHLVAPPQSHTKEPLSNYSYQKSESSVSKSEPKVVHHSSSKHLCKNHACSNKGAAYLEAVTNAYMLSGLLVSELKSDIPKVTTHGDEFVRNNQFLNRRSTSSPANLKRSDQDGSNFTVGYLARQLKKETDCTVPLSKSDAHLSPSALYLARRITMFNSRCKLDQIEDRNLPCPKNSGSFESSKTSHVKTNNPHRFKTKLAKKRYGDSARQKQPHSSTHLGSNIAYQDHNNMSHEESTTCQKVTIRTTSIMGNHRPPRPIPDISNSFKWKKNTKDETSSICSKESWIHKEVVKNEDFGRVEDIQQVKSSNSIKTSQIIPKLIPVSRLQEDAQFLKQRGINSENNSSELYDTDGVETRKLFMYALERQTEEPLNEVELTGENSQCFEDDTGN